MRYPSNSNSVLLLNISGRSIDVNLIDTPRHSDLYFDPTNRNAQNYNKATIAVNIPNV